MDSNISAAVLLVRFVEAAMDVATSKGAGAGAGAVTAKNGDHHRVVADSGAAMMA